MFCALPHTARSSSTKILRSFFPHREVLRETQVEKLGTEGRRRWPWLPPVRGAVWFFQAGGVLHHTGL